MFKIYLMSRPVGWRMGESGCFCLLSEGVCSSLSKYLFRSRFYLEKENKKVNRGESLWLGSLVNGSIAPFPTPHSCYLQPGE